MRRLAGAGELKLAVCGALLAAVSLFAGCGSDLGSGGARNVVTLSAREVNAATGAPTLSRIVDLGHSRLVEGRPIDRSDSNDQFVPGERMLILGDNFGRQPAVQVGSRPAVIIARLETGGIIARVPSATPVGKQTVEVRTPGGVATASIEVMRVGAVLTGAANTVDTLSVFKLASSGLSAAKALSSTVFARAGNVAPAWTADGTVLLIAAAKSAADTKGRGSARVLLLGVASRGETSMLKSLTVPGGSVRALAAAATAPVFAVVTDKAVTLFTVTEPEIPVRYRSWKLPKQWASRTSRAALSPNGARLSLLSRTNNLVAQFDVSALNSGKLLQEVTASPSARVGVAFDLGYSPEGDVLYVATGDDEESAKVGPKPATVQALSVENLDAAHWRVDLPMITRPRALVVLRGQTLDDGSTVLTTARDAALLLLGQTEGSDSSFGVRLGADGAVFPWGDPGSAQRAVQSSSHLRAAQVTGDGVSLVVGFTSCDAGAPPALDLFSLRAAPVPVGGMLSGGSVCTNKSEPLHLTVQP